jgi:hypothetical protein
MSRAIAFILAIGLLGLNVGTARADQAASGGLPGGGTPVLFKGSFATSNQVAYTMASPVPSAGWGNIKGYQVCGDFPSGTASGANATLSVLGAAALPIKINVAGTEVVTGGGELFGSRCLFVNAAANAFILGDPTPGMSLNPVSPHTVTIAEWNSGETFICTVACTLVFPSQATLPNQAGVNIETVGVPLTLTPNSNDYVNQGQVCGSGSPGASVTFPAHWSASLANAGMSGANGLLAVPLGPTCTSNSWPSSQTFAEVHGTREAVALTSNDYVAVAADCGKIKTLPTGATPTVHLPNLNQECTIVFETTVAISYQFLAASGGSTQNSQNFTHSRGTAAGDTIPVNIVAPSASAAKWNISGDLSS